LKRSFTVQQRLDKKWNLNSGDVSMGSFDSKTAAEDAIQLILKPVIYFYDENGNLMKGTIK